MELENTGRRDEERCRESTGLENAEEGGRMRSDDGKHQSWKTLTTAGRWGVMSGSNGAGKC
jgi:hypothetical protein